MGDNRLRETWKGTGSAQPVAEALSEQSRQINGISGSGGVRVRAKRGRIVISGQAGMDWSVLLFGYAISGTTFTVKAGELYWGKEDPIDVPETDVTIGADKTYIYVRLHLGTRAADIQTSATRPGKTLAGSSYFIRWLYRPRYADGNVWMEDDCYGNGGRGVDVTGVFTPT